METLDILNYGESARVENLLTQNGMRRRFLDIGLVKGTRVVCVGISPSGDPKAFLIRGAVIAIRNCDSQTVLIKREEE